jgi:putative Mg2+ transporter-C (MgtC) family protein
MRFIATFHALDFLDTVVSLTVAFILGTLIGTERQYRQRNAGLRTNALVAVAAASFVDLAMNLGGPDGAVRVIAYVVSGIGFLGAGVIMKEGMNVRGLNTAATLWCSAAVGACAGADLVAQAALLTLFTVAGNTLLRPLVNAINRIPFDEQASEATYEVTLLVATKAAADVSEQVADMLEAAKYPVSDVEETVRADGVTGIVATLVSTSVDPNELDAVVAAMEKLPGVANATWTASTKD